MKSSLIQCPDGGGAKGGATVGLYQNGCYDEREGIHSMSKEGELLLTLLAAFAQAESQSISENVKWGIRKRFKLGIPNGNKAPYGYRWNGDGFSIIPEQGTVVKEIYRRYLAGESAYSIAKRLADKGIKG